MKQIIQKKIIRTVTLWMLVMTMGLSMTGCGPKSSFGSQTLDIDYVGSDGEVTEEEVSAKSENPMEWLKKKLTGDKKKAIQKIQRFRICTESLLIKIQRPSGPAPQRYRKSLTTPSSPQFPFQRRTIRMEV